MGWDLDLGFDVDWSIWARPCLIESLFSPLKRHQLFSNMSKNEFYIKVISRESKRDVVKLVQVSNFKNDEEHFFNNLMFNQICLRSHISLLYSPCNSYLSSISDHRIKSCLHVAISHHNMTVIHHQYPIYKEGNGKQKIKETEHQ